ncbi:MAG: formylglycine-generating enzyme family protein [Nitrospiraceae bacterium]
MCAARIASRAHRLSTLILGLTVFLWSADSSAQLDTLRKTPRGDGAAASSAAEMVTVPAGAFRMGTDSLQGLEDERPAHTVWVDTFRIDRTEVTTARYAGFLAATKRPPPDGWETVVLSRHGRKPVIGVSWDDAQAFCAWEGKRLPTEAEWEKAARGTDDRRYPWGNAEPTADRANFGLGARFSYDQVLLPVGARPAGAGPFGAEDLAGNVWEWVQDWYGAAYYEASPEKNPPGPETGTLKVVRGGSWSDLPKYLVTYGRFRLPPETRNSFTGFRCATS